MQKKPIKSTRGRKRGGIKINSHADESDMDAAITFHYEEYEDTNVLVALVGDFTSEANWILKAVEDAMEREKPKPFQRKPFAGSPDLARQMQQCRELDWEKRRDNVMSGLRAVVKLSEEIAQSRPSLLIDLVKYCTQVRRGKFEPVDQVRSLIAQFRTRIRDQKLNARQVQRFLKSQHQVTAEIRSVQNAMQQLGINQVKRGRPKIRKF